MAWTSPKTYVAGAVHTAADLNIYERDNFIMLRAGGIAMASQVAQDFVYATTTVQLGRLAAAAGNPQYSGTAWGIKPDARTTLTISTNVLTVDLLSGLAAEIFTFTLNANITTMTINNIPSTGRVGAFVLSVTADGTPRTWAWLTSTVKWPGSVAPTITSTVNKVDIYSFFTHDAGTTWFGSVIGQVYL